MGKRIDVMTDEEINAQRERAKRNYYKPGRKCTICGEPATGWKYCDVHKTYLISKSKTEPSLERSNILRDIMQGKKI